MAKPGYSRILLLVLVNAAVWIGLTGTWRLVAGAIAVVLLLLVLNFYRDPDRQLPAGAAGCMVSPADGHVVSVGQVDGRLEISIFLSAFDVHVNRAPMDGRVVQLQHTPGKYLPAFLARSSAENERVLLALEAPDGRRLACTQVAGLLARRIENWIEEGQQLKQGQRYGMIHLGSRVDLVMDGPLTPRVTKGDHVKGGLTILAERPGG